MHLCIMTCNSIDKSLQLCVMSPNYINGVASQRLSIGKVMVIQYVPGYKHVVISIWWQSKFGVYPGVEISETGVCIVLKVYCICRRIRPGRCGRSLKTMQQNIVLGSVMLFEKLVSLLQTFKQLIHKNNFPYSYSTTNSVVTKTGAVTCYREEEPHGRDQTIKAFISLLL